MKKLERAIKSAFTKGSPAFPEELLSECSPSQGEIIMTKRNKGEIIMTKRNKKRAGALIALVSAIVMLAATAVVAAGLGRIISSEEALRAAETYFVKTEEDEALKTDIGTALLLGETYGESVTAGEADIGLKEGKLIYNVTFKTCGYEFSAVIDAKTGETYSARKVPDPDWEEVRDQVRTEAEEKLNQLKDKTPMEIAEEKVKSGRFETVFKKHFGLKKGAAIPIDYELNNPGDVEINIDENALTADVSQRLEGYIYSAKIDVLSDEILGSDISEDPDFAGDSVMFEFPDGCIRYGEAEKKAEEYILNNYPEMGNISIDGSGKPTAVTSFAFLGTSLGSGDATYENGYDVSVQYFGTDDGSGELIDLEFEVYVDAAGGLLGIAKRYGITAACKAAREACGLENIDSESGSGEGTELYTCSFTDLDAGVTRTVTVDRRTLEIVRVE